MKSEFGIDTGASFDRWVGGFVENFVRMDLAVAAMISTNVLWTSNASIGTANRVWGICAIVGR